MGTIKRFEDIEAWKKARGLCNEIFEISERTKLSRDFRLRDQVNSSSGSIMDNIAEGFERDSKLEMINSLSIAKGESGEVKSQLYRLLDRKYIDEGKFQELYKSADEIGSMLGSWIKYLNTSEFRGSKFKNRVG